MINFPQDGVRTGGNSNLTQLAPWPFICLVGALMKQRLQRIAIAITGIFASPALSYDLEGFSAVDRRTLSESLGSCAVIFTVAQEMASSSGQGNEAALFAGMADDALTASVVADGSMRDRYVEFSEELRPAIINQLATQPQMFLRGPFAGCLERADIAKFLATSQTVKGSRRVLIE